ncbi:C39 family peptidase [Chloroflexota bacterium]
MRNTGVMLLVVCLLLTTIPLINAQENDENTTALPVTFQLSGLQHEYQGWNNCGPATLTTALSFFGWTDDQYTAAHWLKPDPEDKNVSAEQMAAFVNTFTDVKALVRYGGDLTLLRQLVAHEFPVIIAAGYEPDGYDWMGHYLLVTGYDDDTDMILTQDSFLGPDTSYPQTEIDYFWRHFNRIFIVLYPPEREEELFNLLGEDADAQINATRALETARQEAIANSIDPFAWFNMGTSYTLLGKYEEATIAFEQARNVGEGLPWRMLWYQFGPFEAYYQTGRTAELIDLVQFNLATTANGIHPIEETYYYAGLARAALGEQERAIVNLQQAITINPNFAPAVEALADIAGTDGT